MTKRVVRQRDALSAALAPAAADATNARLSTAQAALEQLLDSGAPLAASRGLTPAADRPRGELLDTLAAIQRAPVARDFALADALAAPFAEFKAWVERARLLFGPEAVVDTRDDAGRTVARTILRGGDVQCVLATRRAAQQRQHAADVRAASLARANALRSVALVAGYAVKLAALIAAPGAALWMVTAAVWRFVREHVLGG